MAEHFCTRARVIAEVSDNQCKKPTKDLSACKGCHVWQDVQIEHEDTVNLDGVDTKVILYGPVLDSAPVAVPQY